MDGQYFIADHINGARYTFGIGFKDLKSIITSFQNGLSPRDYYITCNGKIIEESSTDIQRNQVYHVVPRVCGGKGGFGSMLRAIGAQIEKTTNHEACRDISGRRMRDVNNERQLREWIAKKAEKEKEREEQKQERINRRRAMPNHKFDDPLYDQQKSAVAENLEDAFKTGFAKAQTKDDPSCLDTVETAGCSYVSRKRKAEPSSTAVSSKKNTEWLGIDVDDLSSSENEEEETEVMKSASSSDSDQTDTQEILNIVITNCDSDLVNCKSDQDRNTNISPKGPSSSDLMNSGDNSNQLKVEIGDDDQLKSQSSLSDCREEQLTPKNEGPVDLDCFSSAEDLESVGLDRLKLELMSRGLKCGGNLQERARRLFSVQGLTPDQYDRSLLAKSGKKKNK